MELGIVKAMLALEQRVGYNIFLSSIFLSSEYFCGMILLCRLNKPMTEK